MRIAARCMTLEEFKQIIDPVIQDDEFPYNLSARVEKDLSKVMFDMENCSFDEDFVKDIPVGYKVLKNGMPVLFLHAGGDWEEPLIFILYVDRYRVVRGYVPKAGNTWDLRYNTAHGSQMEREEWPHGQDIPINTRVADFTEIENDIVNRITYYHY